MVRGISAAWNSIMSFIAPAGFPIPVRDPEKPPRTVRSIGWSADARMLAIVYIPCTLSTGSPRSLSTRIRPDLPFRSCSPIMRRFRVSSPPTTACACVVWFRGKANPCTRRWVATTSKKPSVLRRAFFTFFFVRSPKDGVGSVCGIGAVLIDRFYGLFRLWDVAVRWLRGG